MTANNYYRHPNDNPSGQESAKHKKRKSKHVSPNLLPAYFFWAVLLLTSLGLNIYNVYSRFAPESRERFAASGIFEYLFSLPLFGLVAFVFWCASAYATYVVVSEMLKGKHWTNPVYWLLTGIGALCVLTGLEGLLINFPVVLAASAVGMMQYLEILFWNANKRSKVFWAVICITYVVEIGLQYEMLPFHHDYPSTVAFVQGLMSMDFDWTGFRIFQLFLAVIGVFGVEAGDRMIKLVKSHG